MVTRPWLPQYLYHFCIQWFSTKPVLHLQNAQWIVDYLYGHIQFQARVSSGLHYLVHAELAKFDEIFYSDTNRIDKKISLFYAFFSKYYHFVMMDLDTVEYNKRL